MSDRCDPEITACLLREFVETHLGHLVGTYTYPNGFTDKAIAIDDTPDTTKVTGAEVIIFLLPDFVRRYTTEFGFTEEQRWTLKITDRDGGRSLPAIVEVLDRFFIKLRKYYQPKGKDTDQPTLTVQFSSFITKTY